MNYFEFLKGIAPECNGCAFKIEYPNESVAHCCNYTWDKKRKDKKESIGTTNNPSEQI